MRVTPDHLPADVAAVWSEIARTLPEARILGPDFDAYCGQIARLRDAQQRIHEEQMIVPDSKNHPIAHPCIAIEKQAQDEIRKWGDKFKAR